MYKEPKIESSYYRSNKGKHPKFNVSPYYYPKIGKKLYDIVIEKKPKIIVEFGVMMGFSSVCMAQALKEIGEGMIYSYDLWEQYDYKHGNKEEVLNNLKKYGVEDFVELRDGDFNEWCEQKHECDLLHLDISNNGDTIKKVFESVDYCDIIFEGGTLERDQCWWMKEFNKTPINSVKNIVNYKVLAEEFPGLSIIER